MGNANSQAKNKSPPKKGKKKPKEDEDEKDDNGVSEFQRDFEGAGGARQRGGDGSSDDAARKAKQPQDDRRFQTEEQVIAELQATVLRVQVRTLEEQIGNEGGIRAANFWQALIQCRERERPLSRYFAWAPRNDKDQLHYLEPLEWHSVILQFRWQAELPEAKLAREQDVEYEVDGYDVDSVPKPKGSTYKALEGVGGAHGGNEFWPDEKCVDRYRYLKLLQELVLSKVKDVDIEMRWDSRFDKALNFRDEKLLADFDSVSALGYVYTEDAEAARPMISPMQCGRIIFEHMIREGTKFEKKAAEPQRAWDMGSLYTGAGPSKSKERQAQARLEKKRKDDKVMAGRKRDLRQMVMLFKKYMSTYYRGLKLAEVYYLEFIDQGPEFGGWQMRRNWAWEYLIQLGLDDLVRPMEILSNMRQNMIVQLEDYKPVKDKERNTYLVSDWLRRRVLQAVRLFEDRRRGDKETKALLKETAKVSRAEQMRMAAMLANTKVINGQGAVTGDLERAKQAINPFRRKKQAFRLDDRDEDYRQVPTVRRWGNGVEKKQNEYQVETVEWKLLDEVAAMDLEEIE